jgi:hypothetical protein
MGVALGGVISTPRKWYERLVPNQYERFIPGLHTRSYPVILRTMKTAISIPDATFERAERRAKELGVSRSEFYAKAAERWLDALEDEHTTEKIDEALLAAPQEDSEIAFLSRAAGELVDPRESW